MFNYPQTSSSLNLDMRQTTANDRLQHKKSVMLHLEISCWFFQFGEIDRVNAEPKSQIQGGFPLSQIGK